MKHITQTESKCFSLKQGSNTVEQDLSLRRVNKQAMRAFKR